MLELVEFIFSQCLLGIRQDMVTKKGAKNTKQGAILRIFNRA